MPDQTPKVNLLIVEDDRFVRKIYTEVLKGIDKIILSELETAENAIEHIKEHKPDIVIMDYKLPGMNGLEATKQIIMAHPDTIVLVISGDNRSDLEEEMLEVGAISFLKKPVRGKLLYFTIMNFAEIIISKKELKEKMDRISLKSAEEKAAVSYPTKPVEKNSNFIDTFDNRDKVSKAADTLSNNGTKSSAEFFEQLGNDIDYIEDFIESYDEIKYIIDTMTTVVNCDILQALAGKLKEHCAKLNTLLEFPTIVYTLSHIYEFMEGHDIIHMQDIPVKKLAVFLGDFFEMYDMWVKPVFIVKDADDIHFMDVSIMSFGLQMDSIFSDVHVLSENDEATVDEGGSIEFF